MRAISCQVFVGLGRALWGFSVIVSALPDVEWHHSRISSPHVARTVPKVLPGPLLRLRASVASMVGSEGFAVHVHPGHLLTLLSGTVMLLALGSTPDAAVVLVLATAVTALVLGARYLAVAARRSVVSIGRRAREHRLGLAAEPSPQHPRTAGRVRSRAPGLSGTVA